MPFYATVAEVWRHKNNYYVVGALSRSEPLTAPGLQPALSDSAFVYILDIVDGAVMSPCIVWIENGLAYYGSSVPVDITMLTTIGENLAAADALYPAFFEATQTSGPGAVGSVTSSAAIPFSNDDVEAMYNALTLAMQSSTKYWDIASITRLGTLMTITLDETNQPYSALWDSVWADALTTLGVAI